MREDGDELDGADGTCWVPAQTEQIQHQVPTLSELRLLLLRTTSRILISYIPHISVSHSQPTLLQLKLVLSEPKKNKKIRDLKMSNICQQTFQNNFES